MEDKFCRFCSHDVQRTWELKRSNSRRLALALFLMIFALGLWSISTEPAKYAQVATPTSVGQPGPGQISTDALQRHLEIVGERVNIRMAPRTGSQIVAKALKGDIFRLEGKGGGWYEINMFTGEWRYVHQSLAREVSYTSSPPENISLRKHIYKAFGEAERRAIVEADAKYPRLTPAQAKINMIKNIDYGRMLGDRYKLNVVREFGVQPSICPKILVEGSTKEWWRN